MTFLAGLAVGLLIGASAGVLVVALCVATRTADDAQERMTARRHQAERVL